MSVITRYDAEWMARNLTSAYSGFNNHKLITQGCYYEYVHTRTGPGMPLDALKTGVLDVSHFKLEIRL